jgi:uncharacterized membrane protein (UPF0127 family)
MIIHARTGMSIATSIERAVTRATRRRGLLGRDGLEPGTAMILEPCAAVHTAFMRFALDLLFVDREGYAVKIMRDVPPWRMAFAPRAHAVVEMAAGSLVQHDICVGDRLYITA